MAAEPARLKHRDGRFRRVSSGLRTGVHAVGEGWRRTALVALVAGLGPAVAGSVSTADHPLEVATVAAIATTGLLLLLASGLLQAQWLLARQPAVGWLAAATLMVTIAEAPFLAARVAGVEQGLPRGGALDALLVALLLALSLLAFQNRPTRWLHPVAVGLGAGLLLCVLRAWGLRPGPTWSPGPLDAPASTVAPVVVLVTLVGIVGLARARALPTWARTQVVLAILGLGTARVVEAAFHPVDDRLALLAVGIGLVCAAVLVSATMRLLAETVQRQGGQLADLSERAEAAEAAIRRDEEVLHELRSAFGGVSAATALLLHSPGDIPAPRRLRLEHLVEAELLRIEHMVEREPTCDTSLHALDELLAPLVTSQLTQGSDVRWEPCGSWLRLCGHHLSEAVSILLCNAARHAPGRPVTITLRRAPARVQLCVTDEGPGIPASLQSALFERGVRGAHSRGQGLGLHVARRVMRDHGGDVHLERTGPQGSTFVVTLASPLERP